MVASTSARRLILLALGTVVSGAGVIAQVNARLAHDVGHEQSRVGAECGTCHGATDARRNTPMPRGGCDAQCNLCHAPDTSRHHPTGTPVPPLRDQRLDRSTTGRIACRTCHDMQRQETDSVPWRAQSLFDAIFRRRPWYLTYHLAMRNQQGQLCQSCH